MIGALLLAVALIALGAVLFVVSLRVGILVGRRLDGVLEARQSEDSKSIEPASIGQEENRGE